MLVLSPGDYLLYQPADSNLPPWPAVVCTDDLAPNKIASARPHGYFTLILVIKERLEFRYASTGEMKTYDYPNPDEFARTRGLGTAYDRVHEAMDSGMGLCYWRNTTEDQRAEEASSDSSSTLSSDGDSGFDKSQLRLARKLSLAGQETSARSALRTPPTSPPQPRKRQILPLSRSCVNDLPDIRNHFPPASSSTSGANAVNANRGSVRAEDALEGEISDSREFVEFLVGPEKESFMIPKKEMDLRTSFSDRHHGYLRAKGKKTWTIDMPCLESIYPEDFRYIADFMLTGEFGHRRVEDDEQRAIAMAECVAAWEVGERLGMVDILDRIVGKMEHMMPWSTEEVLAFAIVVYRTEEAPLSVYETMKAMLTDFIADNFYDFVKVHGENFTDRFQRIPELEEEVYRKMSERAKQKREAEMEYG